MSAKHRQIFPACVAILLATASDAYAYVDPGAGALLWQLLLSGLFGAIFMVRKVKLWIRATAEWMWAQIRGRKEE